jgi:glutathione S-transferase
MDNGQWTIADAARAPLYGRFFAYPTIFVPQLKTGLARFFECFEIAPLYHVS